MKLKITSLNWALKHVLKEGDTDLFPQPFEFSIIKKQWSQIGPVLGRIEINDHSWKGTRRLMVPKSELGFRAVSQLDPLDAILFAATMREIGSKIEKKRLPYSDGIVFSYRFEPSPNGRLFSTNTGWEEFWKASSKLCDSHAWVLVTDISDWYNQIYHHTIQNQLQMAGVKNPYWHALNNLLANASEGVSRGVPIGPHPAHMLAELAMIPVDQFLVSTGAKFCRYVDDIHIFCQSEKDAHSVLYKLVDYLDRTQKIQLNRRKTKIFASKKFKSHADSNTIDKPINDLEEQMLKAVRLHTKSPYEKISISLFSESDLSTLSKNNIETVLSQYLQAEDVDYIRLRWFIRRLAQVGVSGGIEYIVKNFSEFMPAMSEVGKYFESSTKNYSGSWKNIGDDLIKVYESDVVQASEYLRLIVLSLFSRIKDLNHSNRLTSMYQTASDMCQRKIVLAAATAKANAWLSTLKSEYKNADPWKRRALLYSMRVLPKDEKEFWLKSVRKRVDGLDKLIADSISN